MPALTTHYRCVALTTVLATGIIGPGFVPDSSWHGTVQVQVPDGQGGFLVLTPGSGEITATLVGWFTDQQTNEDSVVPMLFHIGLARSGRTGRRMFWLCTACGRSCTTLYAPELRFIDGTSIPVDWRCRKCYQLQYPRRKNA